MTTTSFLQQAGDLERIPFAAVLIAALNERVTGGLLVEHDGGTSKIFFRDGIPVGSQSFSGFKPLGQLLLAQGRIDVPTLNESLAAMAATGKPQGAVLVELGALRQDEVDAALTEQQEQYLTRIAGLDRGHFRLDTSRPPPEWTRTIRIRPLRAIVQTLEKAQAAALVVSALQPAAGGPIALARGYQQLAPAFGWSKAESQLISRLGSLTTMEGFFEQPGVAPERARAILAALLLLGLAQARPAGQAIDTVPGIVVDLADIAGVEVDMEPHPPRLSPPPRPASEYGAEALPPAATSPVPPVSLRRSDPEEARKRRQRLLQRAMKNMGIGPLSRPPSGREGAAEAVAAEPGQPPAPAGAAEAELRRAYQAQAARFRSPDLFTRLGLERGAGAAEVKQAYFALAKQFHPDRFLSPGVADLAGAAKDLFAALNEAYETLSDDRRRAAWMERNAGGPGGAAPTSHAETATMDFQKGEACLRTRDFTRARGFYEAAIRANPRAEYQAALAWALAFDPKSPNKAKAKELLAAALQDPTCDRAAYTAAMLARDAGDEDGAEHMFRIALRANPRHVEAEREIRLIEARRRRK